MAQNNQIQPWQANLVGKIHPHAVNAFKLLFDAIQDHDTAIVAVNAKVTSATTTPATVTPSSSTAASSSFPYLGDVNPQSGTTYITSLTDSGGLLVLGNAATVNVTLAISVGVPWFMSALNLGPAVAIFTPASGTINNQASLTIEANAGAWIFFDGTNFWAPFTPVMPKTKALVAHEWLDSYDAATGQFTQSQPDFVDLTGTAAVGQIPTLPQSKITGLVAALAALAPLASPTFTGTVTQPDASVLTAATLTTSATAGTGSALPALPDQYVTVTINGTAYKIPLFLP